LNSGTYLSTVNEVFTINRVSSLLCEISFIGTQKNIRGRMLSKS